MILSNQLTSSMLHNCDLRAIAAMSLNGVIGSNNTIPWKIPEELHFFRDTTINASILMGRKTFQSIGKVLPMRKNIIITRSNIEIQGATVIHSFDELLNIPGTIWVCGGASIYRTLLPACRELYLSVINHSYPGDTFFPDYKSFFGNRQIIKQSTLFHVEKMLNNELI